MGGPISQNPLFIVLMLHFILFLNQLNLFPRALILFPRPLILFLKPLILFPRPLILFLRPLILFLRPLIYFRDLWLISETFDFISETFDFISETFDFISKGIWVLASYLPWGNGTDTKMCERKIFQGIVNVFSDHIWQWWTATSGASCCEQTAKFKRLLKVKGIHLGSEKGSWVLSSIYFINNLIIAKVMSVLMRFHLTSFSVMPKTLSVLEWILPFSHHFHEDECTFESIFTLMRFRRKRSAS